MSDDIDLSNHFDVAQNIIYGKCCQEYAVKILSINREAAAHDAASNIISYLLFYSSNEDEYQHVLTFVSLLVSKFPFIINDGIQRLMKNIDEFKAISKAYDQPFGNRLNFLRNIAAICSSYRELNRHNATRIPKSLAVTMGFNLLAIDGHLQLAVLNIFKDDITELTYERFRSEKPTTEAVEFIREWIDLFESLKPLEVRRLTFDTLSGLARGLSAVGAFMLCLITKIDDEKTSTEIIKSFFQMCKYFLYLSDDNLDETKVAEYRKAVQPILRWYITNFCVSFMDCVFDISHELFGVIPGTFECPEQEVFTEIPLSLVPECSKSTLRVENNPNCLQKLQLRPFRYRSTATLAHTGFISDQHIKIKPREWSKTESHRSSLFVASISYLGSTDDRFMSGDVKSSFYCDVGSRLTHLVCTNGLTGALNFLELNIEKDCIAQYTETYKRMGELPLIYDLIMFFAQIGMPMMCSVLPLMKALFLFIINKHGSTPRKDEKLLPDELKDIAQLFTILLSAHLIPQKYKAVFEFFRTVSHHEAYLILTVLWDYVRIKLPLLFTRVNFEKTGTAAEKTDEKASKAEELKIRHRAVVAIIMPIIERHVLKLGRLMPEIVEDDDELSESDVW